ncbi:ABC transporter ATP-binding protein [Microvirga sp. TS319]|uniref:ABC transporter ATP-binding protein n=1 Tax=Microvirga sp. TS319 TaxID=3241165 RepID=UPI00351A4B04
MARIELRQVSKSYGAARIIAGVNLPIENGEFVVLVGPSGCGKSTLLRMIAGLEPISGGELVIDGEIVNNLPPQKRDVAMVFQSYALYPHYTVYDNMAFGLKLRGNPKADTDARVRRAAEILGLQNLLTRYPKNLSGGQRQRVAMGRAIVRNPRLYLFDEPLSNLDAKLRISMRSEIKSLHQSLRTTTVYVTHDQVEAMTMADRIVVLRDGNVEQIGTPMELYRSPANEFVAGFIGAPTMNFVRSQLPGGPDREVRCPGGDVPIRLPKASTANGEILIGIRPEHLQPTTGPGLINGRIKMVEPTGPSDYVIVDTQAGPVSAVLPTSYQARSGDSIRLAAEAPDIHLFNAQTGRRLEA